VKELEILRDKQYSWENKILIPGINENKTKNVDSDCLHIKGEFDLKTSDSFGFIVRHSKKIPGTEILYNVKRGTLSVLGSTVPLPVVDNKITLEILIDRSSIEIFANGGQTVISNCFFPADGKEIVLFTTGGELGVEKLELYELKSIWDTEKKK
jgi:sucrose-6-phosphate hydrolase SacC (GH32 family)